MKLDRSREFGTIHGGDNNACYEQDGFQFDARGALLIDVALTAAGTPRKRMGRPPKVEVADVDAQIEASMAIE